MAKLYLAKYRLEPGHKEIKTEKKGDTVVDYQIVDVVVKTGDSEEEFYTTQKYKAVGKHSRQKELNKYRDDVGCKNIIEKYARQGIDAGDGRFAAKGQGLVDATKLPKDLEATIALSKEMDPTISAAWKAIPKELKGSMNIKDFAEKFDAKMFKTYLNAMQQARVQAKQQKVEPKVEAPKGEEK